MLSVFENKRNNKYIIKMKYTIEIERKKNEGKIT